MRWIMFPVWVAVLSLAGCADVRTPSPPRSGEASPSTEPPAIVSKATQDSTVKAADSPEAAAASQDHAGPTSAEKSDVRTPPANTDSQESAQTKTASNSEDSSTKKTSRKAPLDTSGSAGHVGPNTATTLPGKPDAGAADTAARLTPTALDFSSLQRRLRDTHAIGVFTKLSLKNQVDDLVAAFRDYHQGSAKVPLTELRERYDLLLMKVLTLLQDGDPALASTIASSKEAIWGILADPQKFSSL